MKTRLLIAFAALLLAGCSTFEKRAEEKAAVFSQLDPATQEKLRKGEIEVGNTPDMVFIALGEPDAKTEQITADHRDETWIYNSYYTEYRGSEQVGYRRIVTYNNVSKSYYVYYEPVRVDVYRDRVEDRIRITFRDGKVTVIEQAK
jgi:hypothetical protein